MEGTGLELNRHVNVRGNSKMCTIHMIYYRLYNNYVQIQFVHLSRLVTGLPICKEAANLAT